MGSPLLGRDPPGEQLIDSLGRMVLQSRQYIGEPRQGIGVVELGGLDQGVDLGCTPTALIAAGR